MTDNPLQTRNHITRVEEYFRFSAGYSIYRPGIIIHEPIERPKTIKEN
jgi:hypothetical protein